MADPAQALRGGVAIPVLEIDRADRLAQHVPRTRVVGKDQVVLGYMPPRAAAPLDANIGGGVVAPAVDGIDHTVQVGEAVDLILTPDMLGEFFNRNACLRVAVSQSAGEVMPKDAEEQQLWITQRQQDLC
eukprot:2706939-Pleurochrysis_carterae.AAC.3